ncbi:unnamed protein product [Pleuronectes platessa]|uniref:Uncharacterized protein n=1 Tax=Pleuronectes platessa TaxID=8262 RepID=A0A9N7TGD6_PLEPL|nr:unnamed protein product [Pleuronectes platessa]
MTLSSSCETLRRFDSTASEDVSLHPFSLSAEAAVSQRSLAASVCPAGEPLLPIYPSEARGHLGDEQDGELWTTGREDEGLTLGQDARSGEYGTDEVRGTDEGAGGPSERSGRGSRQST